MGVRRGRNTVDEAKTIEKLKDKRDATASENKLRIDYRILVGVIALLALFWLAWFSWSRDQALYDALRGTDLTAAQKEAMEREIVMSDARALADKLGVSDNLKEIIRQEEGEVLTVYRDITGLPTVGAGHLVTPEDGLSVGDRITREQMDRLLEQDLEKAAQAVRRLLANTPVKQNEFDALVDLVYNVGPGNVSPRKSPALNDAIRNKDYERIAENLIYSKARDGRRAGGLVNRSERRKAMFREGNYEDPR